MTFDDILAQVLALLQREGRVSYRALKVRFQLDDDLLEAVKDELIYAKKRDYSKDTGLLSSCTRLMQGLEAVPLKSPCACRL